MIRRANEIKQEDRTAFGGPGQLHAKVLLEPDEFNKHGRLFNHCTLHTGDAIGVHPHENEFEIYYILTGEGLYNDNGTETKVSAGDFTICYSGEKHGIKNVSDADLTFIALIIYN